MTGFTTTPARVRTAQTRTSQRGLLPGAVKSRNLDSFVFGSIEDQATTVLGNNEQATVSFFISQSREYEEKGDLYVSVYVGSVAAANLLPGGSGVDESQWQVIGPYFDYSEWESAGFPAHEDYVTLYIRNISAGSQTLIINSKWKYISAREGGNT